MIYRGLTSYGPTARCAASSRNPGSRSAPRAGSSSCATLRFQNGEKVTSADVKWTIEQIAGGTLHRLFPRRDAGRRAHRDARRPHRAHHHSRTPSATLPIMVRRPTTCRSSRGTRHAGSPIGAGPFRINGAGARHLDRARTPSPASTAPGLPKLKRIRCHRLCRREPARRGAAVRRRRHDRIRALAVDGRDRGRSAR